LRPRFNKIISIRTIKTWVVPIRSQPPTTSTNFISQIKYWPAVLNILTKKISCFVYDLNLFWPHSAFDITKILLNLISITFIFNLIHNMMMMNSWSHRFKRKDQWSEQGKAWRWMDYIYIYIWVGILRGGGEGKVVVECGCGLKNARIRWRERKRGVLLWCSSTALGYLILVDDHQGH